MKHLKTFENFNTPYEDESLNPHENSNHDNGRNAKLKTKEEKEQEEKEAIERLTNGFVTIAIPNNEEGTKVNITQ